MMNMELCHSSRQVGDDYNLLELCHSSTDSDADNDIVIDGIDDGFLLSQSREDKALSVGAQFQDSNNFKQVLHNEAIANNFTVKIKASDRTRVVAICAYQGCPWRVRASLCPDGQSFEIRKVDGTHLSPGVNRARNKQATSSWVAHQIQDIMKKNPEIPPKHINNSLETTYGLSLPYMKLWRSREQARNIIFGSTDDNYKWVPTLKSELLYRNLGSHVVYTYDIHDNSFKRLYISFKVCVDGFLAGCKPLIGLDACHLKSKYLGVLLSANSLDGNNGIFTIAFTIVDSESKNTWQWFLRNLVETIGCRMDHLAFISDMEKGLAEAMKTIFSFAEHMVCIRHLWKNMRKFFHCGDSTKLRSLVWTAANAFTKLVFDDKVTELFHINPQVGEERWCLMLKIILEKSLHERSNSSSGRRQHRELRSRVNLIEKKWISQKWYVVVDFGNSLDFFVSMRLHLSARNSTRCGTLMWMSTIMLEGTEWHMRVLFQLYQERSNEMLLMMVSRLGFQIA